MHVPRRPHGIAEELPRGPKFPHARLFESRPLVYPTLTHVPQKRVRDQFGTISIRLVDLVHAENYFVLYPPNNTVAQHILLHAYKLDMCIGHHRHSAVASRRKQSSAYGVAPARKKTMEQLYP